VAIDDFINTAVTVKKSGATVSRYGIKTPAADVTINARVEEANDLAVEIEGRQVSVNALLIVDADANITVQDRVILPDDPGVEMEVVRVDRSRHGDGSVHHKEVLVGRARRVA
jgi:uncharacterized protein involved in outer membrane biogenesis